MTTCRLRRSRRAIALFALLYACPALATMPFPPIVERPAPEGGVAERGSEDPTLAAEIEATVCPGPAVVSISSATPNGTIALFAGVLADRARLTDGVCEGLELAFTPERMVRRLWAETDGTAELNGKIPVWACGGSLQAVDLETCGVSAPIRLPAPGAGNEGEPAAATGEPEEGHIVASTSE